MDTRPRNNATRGDQHLPHVELHPFVVATCAVTDGRPLTARPDRRGSKRLVAWLSLLWSHGTR